MAGAASVSRADTHMPIGDTKTSAKWCSTRCSGLQKHKCRRKVSNPLLRPKNSKKISTLNLEKNNLTTMIPDSLKRPTRRAVAQICNLMHRRFLIGWPFETAQRVPQKGNPQNTILRYGRLQIYATSNWTDPRFEVRRDRDIAPYLQPAPGSARLRAGRSGPYRAALLTLAAITACAISLIAADGTTNAPAKSTPK